MTKGAYKARKLNYPARAAALVVLIGGSFFLTAAGPTPVPSPAATATPPKAPTVIAATPTPQLPLTAPPTATSTRTPVPVATLAATSTSTPVIQLLQVPTSTPLPTSTPVPYVAPVYIPAPPAPPVVIFVPMPTAVAAPSLGLPDILRFALPPLPATVTPAPVVANVAAKTATPAGAWRPASQPGAAGSSQPRQALQVNPADEVPLPREPATPRPVQAAATKAPPRAPVVNRTPPPAEAKALTKSTSATSTGSAAGGSGPTKQSGQSQMLMLFGLFALTMGGSWGFYYFLRPPKD